MSGSNWGAKRPDKNTAGSNKNARSAIQACSVHKNWVELEHSTKYPDDYNQVEPAANTEYCLTLGDGSKIEGTLDANGFARHDDIPDGNISVQYEPDIDEVVKTLKKELQTALNGLVQIEHDEYAKIEKEFQNAKLFGLDFPGSNTIAKAYMMRNALRTGVWNGITGILGFAWDLVKGAGKALYEIGLRTSPLTAPRKFREDLAKLKEATAELQRFKDEDLEAYVILMSDPDVYGMFMQYGKDIIKAQHLLEYLEASGEIGFDIALTIITLGVGAASNARHLARLKKLKILIDKLVAALKKKALRKKIHKDKPNKKVVTKNNMQENGAKGAKPKRKPRQPSKNNPNIDHSKTTKNADGSTTYYDKNGNKVTYNKDGYPDFSEHSIETIDDIPGMNGDYGHDSKLANKVAGFDATPDDYVWHHVENGKKMELISKEVHGNFPHTGGASGLKDGSLP